MPSPIRAVLFDYGLVLTGPPDATAWAEMLAVTGLAAEAYDRAYWAPRHDYDLGTLGGAAYFEAVGRHAGMEWTSAQIEALLDADSRLWTRPNQPMIDFAGRLQAAGTPTGILSNLGDRLAAGVVSMLPWLSAFTHATYSHTLGMTKPDREIYDHAASGLETPPGEILFIDDREENIDGARRAGMQAIQYTTQEGFEEEVKSLGLETLWLTGSW